MSVQPQDEAHIVRCVVSVLRSEIAADRPAKVLVSFPLLDYLRKTKDDETGEYLWQPGLRRDEPNRFMDTPIDRDLTLGRWSYRFVDTEKR